MQIRPREILNYTTPSGRNPYRQWYTRITDEKAQIAISNRITRLRVGNFGDFKRLGQDLYELRIHYGPGYRVYFGVFQNDIVILLVEEIKEHNSGILPGRETIGTTFWNE